MFGPEGPGNYRLALRCAHLIRENDPPSRQDIFDYLREAYKLRSRIVHGRAPREEVRIHTRTFTPTDFISIIEQYLREVLRNVLIRRGRESVKEMIEALDKTILMGPGGSLS